MYIPHPFDPVRHNLRETELRALASEGLIDALETFNAKTSLSHLNAQAAALAEELDLPARRGE